MACASSTSTDRAHQAHGRCRAPPRAGGSSHACWTLPGALAPALTSSPQLNVNPDSMLHITSKLGLSAESTTTLQGVDTTTRCHHQTSLTQRPAYALHITLYISLFYLSNSGEAHSPGHILPLHSTRPTGLRAVSRVPGVPLLSTKPPQRSRLTIPSEDSLPWGCTPPSAHCSSQVTACGITCPIHASTSAPWIEALLRQPGRLST